MTIEKYINGTELTIKMTGRLTTTTSPQFEAVLQESSVGMTTIILDFAELEYLSSSGLRVLLKTQKVMNKRGKLIIRNVNKTIEEIFTVTGFYNVFTVE